MPVTLTGGVSLLHMRTLLDESATLAVSSVHPKPHIHTLVTLIPILNPCARIDARYDCNPDHELGNCKISGVSLRAQQEHCKEVCAPTLYMCTH